MAIGFTQKHIEQLPLDNLTTEQFLSLAIETSSLLGWVFGNISKTGFIAYTNNGLFSWNAELKLKIKDGLATLQSQSRGDDLIDLVENNKNLLSFVSTFNYLKKILTPEELASKYEELKANFV
jgi:rhomboid protease GluP